jgi:apolipoprotein N-acyltransferase
MEFVCKINRTGGKIFSSWEKVKAKPVVAFSCGALSGLSFAPISLFILMAVGFSLFLHGLREQKTWRGAFLWGLFFGLGYFITSTYWVALSFQCVGLGYLVPLVMLGFASLLALFPAGACALTIFFKKFGFHKNSLFTLLFTFFWSLCEWLRGHVFTGFPWNLNGYVWDLSILQSTAWIGIYGLSLLTTWFACIWAWGSRKLIAITCACFGLLWLGGTLRLKNPLEHTAVHMRLVQPSIDQSIKWHEKHLNENMHKHLALSEEPSKAPLQAIIWPEAAIAYDLSAPQLRTIIKTVIPQHGFLILGGIRREITKKNEIRIFNSLFCLNNDGRILTFYDKAHLVPFGEYVPFRSFLPIQKLTEGTTDYTEGGGLKTLHIGDMPPFAPLICYEAVFPNQVVNSADKPQWILNLTNDAWYGRSSGPYQHLAIVRVRAIEEGLPLVRAANNGISAIISPYGEVIGKLDLYKVGVLDFYLPKPLPSTVYSQYHNLVYGLMMIIVLCFLITLKEKNG